jgi:phosphatidylserine/phosphatidylglycerophosphate/cardiolipin synthase-like enzyme
VHFFADRTYVDLQGVRRSDQQIFNEALRMIREAEQYILLDMFFYSDFSGIATTTYRQLSRELTDALVAKKRANPSIVIQVITDPINIFYGGYTSPHFDTLEQNGIPVIVTNVTPLRDSNPLYSAVWRTFFQWLPDRGLDGVVPNALDAHKPPVSVVSYLNSFNFKANHRKVLLTDHAQAGNTDFSVLITSGNPHDGSSAHSNTALRIDGQIGGDVLASERAVAALSGAPFIELTNSAPRAAADTSGTMQVQLLTEGAIEKKILERIHQLSAGDALSMAMFYISDREIVRALKKAEARGVTIRLLLDPNKDAFGREKNGIPNRQVAAELMRNTTGNTEVRWCDTHGEQCHSKLLIFEQGDTYAVIQGSANLTRRNLDNFNLETNVYFAGPGATPAIADIRSFFETSWHNEPNRFYSTAYETYADESLGKTLWYRFGEFTGMSRY